MRVCVFCGSSSGKSKVYLEQATDLGEKLVGNGHYLVYGGASIGVMGKIADTMLAKDGHVIGVMPKSLIDWEVGHQGLTEFIEVETMHTRKEKMYELSDCFVTYPGGFGTLDELFEITTWAQLQYHKKPIYLVNVNGYFDHLIKHIELSVAEGFVSKEHYELITVVNSNEELMERIN
ncbi:TIGR00730 family Rossman fold protein [Halobacteriovorax sp. DPLXC-1]|uniref:LOG family protein n=1 Tax=Halobacteriovorax sp. DPLXC-1 TaxID=3110771 RepID=UPI002FF37853